MKLNLKKGQRVLIYSDYAVEEDLYRAILLACTEAETEPTLLISPPIHTWGSEPPNHLKTLAESGAVDVFINAASKSIGHTDTMRLIRSKEILTISFSGQTVDSITKGPGTAGYEEVLRNTTFFAEALDRGERVQVTAKAGTCMEFSILGRSAYRLTGFYPSKSDSIAYPSGEAACAPVEGSAEGVIVVDSSMHQIGACQDPITLEVRNGKVISINGGEEAGRLRALLKESGDDFSTNIAEFAMGSNPKARLTGNVQEEKIKLGTIHFALGNSLTLGGKVKSKTHLDCVVKNARVVIDGKPVLEDSKPITD